MIWFAAFVVVVVLLSIDRKLGRIADAVTRLDEIAKLHAKANDLHERERARWDEMDRRAGL